MRLHALTVSVWALGAAFCVHAAPNPLYATIVLLTAVLVVEAQRRDTLIARSFPIFVAIAAVFGVLRALLTIVTTHGIDRPLFSLPFRFTLPDVFGGFTIGGSVERSVVFHSFASAYTIVVFIAVFAAWNAVVSHHEVLRVVPKAFHEPALAVTIAIAFVPSTIASVRAIAEAERARTGNVGAPRGRMRRRVLPVLETGLERAISLSESMDSRGYGHVDASIEERAGSWLVLLGLLACAAAFVALVSNASVVAAVLFVTGLVVIGLAITLVSRAGARTRYRPRPLRPVDWWVMASSAIAPAAVLVASLAGNRSLQWSPARLEVPPVSAGVVAALVLLAAPVVTVWFERRETQAVASLASTS